jgi:hypothetical protein
MVKRLVAAGFALALAGCAAPEVRMQRDDARLPQELLYVATGDGVGTVDVSTGELSQTPGQAVFTAGFSHVFLTAPDPRGTSLRLLDPDSLYEVHELVLDGDFTARVAAEDGSLVALMASRPEGDSAYLPAGRSRTELRVADVERGTLRTYDLAGNFEPEAFSTDDNFLYLIEYLPANDPSRYRIRTLDLEHGTLTPIGRLKGAPPQMRGTGRTQVVAPDGDVLYTLYTRQGPNGLHVAPQSDGGGRYVYAFIHMLNLAEGWAHCIDLPSPFGKGDATAGAVTTTPSGSRLFVADPSTNSLAAVDRTKLRVVRRTELGLDEPTAIPSVAATDPSGGTVYVASGETLRSFDATTLRILDTWELPQTATSLQTSFDGAFVYVGTGDEVLVLDAEDGAEVERIGVPGIQDIVHVGVLS